MNTITQDASKVNEIIQWIWPIDRATDLQGIPDNVYPFAGGAEDRWAVVIDEKQIAWSSEYSTACMIYVSALQTRREHAERCPADFIPFSGEPVPYESDADDYSLCEPTL